MWSLVQKSIAEVVNPRVHENISHTKKNVGFVSVCFFFSRRKATAVRAPNTIYAPPRNKQRKSDAGVKGEGARGLTRNPRADMKEADASVGFDGVPPAGFEPALPPPEGGALSPELRGPVMARAGISEELPSAR